MILDAIAALFEPLFAALGAILAGIFNLIAAGLEMLIALFVPAFKMKRIERRKRVRGAHTDANDGGSDVAEAPRSRFSPLLVGAGVALLILGAVFLPVVTKRTITLVAKDGHSLPRAAVILHTTNGDEHLRTDNAGNLKAPRFGLLGLTVKDPRYVEETWGGDAGTRQLVVRRTVLGAGLDRLAGKLLMKPADE